MLPPPTALLALILAAAVGACSVPPAPAPPAPAAGENAAPKSAPAEPEATTRPHEAPAALRVAPYVPVQAPAPMAIVPSPVPPSGGFAPGLPAGPITNYGTGGMQQMPGAPPNPPYPPGGLMH